MTEEREMERRGGRKREREERKERRGKLPEGTALGAGASPERVSKGRKARSGQT